MVEQKFGMETVNALIENNELSTDGVYSAVGTYHHSEMVSLVVDLGKRSGVAIRFAQGLEVPLPNLQNRLPRDVRQRHRRFWVLASVDQEIHVEVLKLYPSGAALVPDGIVEENVLQMDYLWTVPWALAHGLIEACGEHYNEGYEIDFQPQTGTALMLVCHPSPGLGLRMSDDAYKKVFERERLARKEAERITELKSRELFDLNTELKKPTRSWKDVFWRGLLNWKKRASGRKPTPRPSPNFCRS